MKRIKKDGWLFISPIKESNSQVSSGKGFHVIRKTNGNQTQLSPTILSSQLWKLSIPENQVVIFNVYDQPVP